MALTAETCQLLADVLARYQGDGVLLRRNKPIWFGFQKIVLTNDILIRKKMDKTWCYDVMDDQSCGQGRYGSAHAVVAKITISPPRDGSATMVVQPKNCRVFKLQNNAALNEYKLMKRCSHLGVRGLFPGVPSVISMRKFEGVVLNDALNADRQGYPFSLQQRIRLALSLLRALKIQMHDNMICHRDIKPDNIFYDSKTGKVVIFDLGISQLIGDNSDKRSRGNAAYSAPEDFISIRTGRPVSVGEIRANIGRRSLLTAKSDLYSMARIISLIFGNQDRIFFEKAADYNGLLSMRAAMEWVVSINLSLKLDGFDPDLMQKLKTQLTFMTSVDPGLRPDLIECIQYFDQLYLDCKLQDSPDDLHSTINEAHALGLNTFWKLHEISRSHHLQSRVAKAIPDLNLHPESSMQLVSNVLRKKFSKTYRALALEIDQWCLDNGADMSMPSTSLFTDYERDSALSSLLQTLIKAIAELDDSEAAVVEFIDTLDICCLLGIRSHQALHEKVFTVISSYINQYHELNRLYDLHKAAHNDSIVADIDHFFLTLFSYRLTLDDIHQASLHMERKLAKITVHAPALPINGM